VLFEFYLEWTLFLGQSVAVPETDLEDPVETIKFQKAIIVLLRLEANFILFDVEVLIIRVPDPNPVAGRQPQVISGPRVTRNVGGNYA